jgi:hypothetical protein
MAGDDEEGLGDTPEPLAQRLTGRLWVRVVAAVLLAEVDAGMYALSPARRQAAESTIIEARAKLLELASVFTDELLPGASPEVED